jgi:hypothetical protein
MVPEKLNGRVVIRTGEIRNDYKNLMRKPVTILCKNQ